MPKPSSEKPASLDAIPDSKNIHGKIPMISDLGVGPLMRERDKKQKRESIMDAVEHLLLTKSWETMNFGEIAKEAGLSRPLIYVYFPTKDHLFHALCDRGAVVLRRAFSGALSAQHSGIDQVEMIGRAYQKFSSEYPVYFGLHMLQLGKDPQMNGEKPQGTPHPAIELLSHAISRGLEDGSIRKECVRDIRLTALSLWSFALGLLTVTSRKRHFLLAHMKTGPDEVVDHGLQLMRGMLATPPADQKKVTPAE